MSGSGPEDGKRGETGSAAGAKGFWTSSVAWGTGVTVSCSVLHRAPLRPPPRSRRAFAGAAASPREWPRRRGADVTPQDRSTLAVASPSPSRPELRSWLESSSRRQARVRLL